MPEYLPISIGANIEVGDKILINGSIANHGMAILSKRYNLHLQTEVISDCAPLNHLIAEVLKAGHGVHFMRDATRGGLATVLCECVARKPFGIFIDEALIPLDENVRFLCEMFGFDPLYIANEGKVVMVVKKADAEHVLAAMHEFGKHSAIIGEIVNDPIGKICLQTSIGGTRILEMLAGDQLPRIC
jgi:hydrogenase expression/formation protein HypE